MKIVYSFGCFNTVYHAFEHSGNLCFQDCNLNCHFQLKGHGLPGEHLELVHQRVALEVNPRQEATLAIDPALVLTQIYKIVLVR